MKSSRWNPAQWGKVYTYSSVAEALTATEFPDGVHRLPLGDDRYLEVLFSGNPLKNRGLIPVFFNGAIANRSTTTGPYFSGKGLSAKLGVGLISIADPSIIIQEDLNIAWYTGLPGESAQDIQGRFISHVTEVAHQAVLIIGGSAGGFGALNLANRVDRSRVFVWNPQTNLLNYYPDVARSYLSAVLGGEWTDDQWKDRARKALDAGGIQYSLVDSPLPSTGLIFQNDSDWHLRNHLVPYLDDKGLIDHGTGYLGNYSRGVAIFNFGSGHAVPHPDLTQLMVNHLLDPSASAWTAFQLLEQEGYLEKTNLNQFPMDLRHDKVDIRRSVKPVVTRYPDRIVADINPEARAAWPSLTAKFVADYQGKRLGFMERNDAGVSSLATTKTPVRLRYYLVDQWGHVIHEGQVWAPNEVTRGNV